MSETAMSGHDPSRPLWRRVLASRALYLILLILLLGFAFAQWIDLLGGPAALRDDLGPAAPAVIVSALAVVSATPFPSELLAVPTAGIFGFWPGALLVWVAWLLAAFIQYFIARRAASELDFERTRSRLPSWLRRVPVSHPFFLIVTRWFPGGPHLVNAAAGVYGVNLRRHAWCAAVSILPQAMFVSAVGNALVWL